MTPQVDIHSLAPWPYFAPDEIEAAQRVLASGRVNYWTGDEGRLFEREFAEWCGTKHAVAVANGTVAIELALHALDLQPGDEVVVTPRTFIASVSAVVLRGLTPVFADVDRDSGNITAETVRAVLTPRTRAIIAVHLAGWPCDMDPLMALAEEHGLYVIEDCAQCHGAAYRGRKLGSIGHVAAWSFCQDKIMTTAGEGGMLTTNSNRVWERAWSYKDHGKSYDAVYNREHAPGFRWLHESFGTNWRLTEVQSAIGRIQLRKVDGWVAQRRRNAAILRHQLSPLKAVRVPTPPPGLDHAYYKFYAYVQPEYLKPGWSRDRLLAELGARGVPCFSGSCSEVYRESAFAEHSCQPAAPLPSAAELGATSLMFPVHPTIHDNQMARIASEVGSVVQFAARMNPQYAVITAGTRPGDSVCSLVAARYEGH